MSAAAPERSRLSIEPGHFYAAAFAEGTDALAQRFRHVRYYAEAVSGPADNAAFMFDDYHNRPDSKVRPRDIVEQILEASNKAGLEINYVAREAACTRMSEHVLGILRGTGYIRETEKQGFLLDDQDGRLGQSVGPAMSEPPVPVRQRPRGHTFIDIEVYDRPTKKTVSWACPYLAAIWQALRLGVLHDEAFDNPVRVGETIPDWNTWEDMPPLIQLTPDAKPFVASRTFSILPTDFLHVEGAVDKIITRLGTAMGENPPLGQRIERAFLTNM